MSKKIVFFGNEKLATGIPPVEPLILKAVKSAGFEIEQHITGKLSELQSHEANLGVLAAYGKIIPQTVLDEFPLGIINVHPSLLPQYRGPTPIEQAILDGVTKTGVSIMRLTAGMDEGPVYTQKTVHVKGQESKIELATSLQVLGAQLLTDVLLKIDQGKAKARQQPHPDRATYSQLIHKEDGIINWSKSAEQIEREVRAYADWPKSSCIIADREVVITQAQVLPGTGAPGQISTTSKALVIFCGTGALLVERLKPTGKKEMDAKAFINGYLR